MGLATETSTGESAPQDSGDTPGLSTHGVPVAPVGAQFTLLRQDMAFLNHGSFGACPEPVFAAYQRWQRELEAQPVEFLGRRHAELLARARDVLAAHLGTTGERIAFVPNATFGMNVVAHALALGPGDEVLVTDHEYGAVRRTWEFITAQRGATLRVQHIALPLTTPDDFLDALWQGVGPRTRAIVLDHITSPTALIFPMAEVCRRAAEQGILTIIDGAHAPGQIELHLDNLGADFYTGNCHKWLCAPKGAGFLYVRAGREHLLQPLVVNAGWQGTGTTAAPLRDWFTWTGTADPAAYLTVPDAIAFEREHDWPAVRAACHQLASEARARLGELTSMPAISPDSPAWFAQMCAAPLPVAPESWQAFHDALWEEHHVEVPITQWDGHPLIRVSIQAYNSPADVDRLIDAVRALLPRFPRVEWTLA